MDLEPTEHSSSDTRDSGLGVRIRHQDSRHEDSEFLDVDSGMASPLDHTENDAQGSNISDDAYTTAQFCQGSDMASGGELDFDLHSLKEPSLSSVPRVPDDSKEASLPTHLLSLHGPDSSTHHPNGEPNATNTANLPSAHSMGSRVRQPVSSEIQKTASLTTTHNPDDASYSFHLNMPPNSYPLDGQGNTEKLNVVRGTNLGVPETIQDQSRLPYSSLHPIPEVATEAMDEDKKYLNEDASPSAGVGIAEDYPADSYESMSFYPERFVDFAIEKGAEQYQSLYEVEKVDLKQAAQYQYDEVKPVLSDAVDAFRKHANIDTNTIPVERAGLSLIKEAASGYKSFVDLSPPSSTTSSPAEFPQLEPPRVQSQQPPTNVTEESSEFEPPRVQSEPPPPDATEQSRNIQAPVPLPSPIDMSTRPKPAAARRANSGSSPTTGSTSYGTHDGYGQAFGSRVASGVEMLQSSIRPPSMFSELEQDKLRRKPDKHKLKNGNEYMGLGRENLTEYAEDSHHYFEKGFEIFAMMDPKSPEAQKDMTKDFIDASQAYFNDHDYDSALVYVQAAENLKPENPEEITSIIMLKANILDAQGKIQQAQECRERLPSGQ